jgi:hypothetical protein
LSFETIVAVGERRVRTLEGHRYHVNHHRIPALGRRRIATITVDDIAGFIRSPAGAAGGTDQTARLGRRQILVYPRPNAR